MNEQENGERMSPPEDRTSGQPALSAGAQLAAARQSMGWTIEDVAALLNLAPRQVQAIEADNHAALPGVAVTRGFIRAYAKLVRIDPVPLIATVTPEKMEPVDAVLPRKPASAPFAESRLPSLGRRRRNARPLAAIFCVIVVATVGYWGLQNRTEVAEMLDAAPTTVAIEPVSEPVSGPPADQPADVAVPTEPMLPPHADTAQTPDTSEPAPAASATVVPEVAPESAPAAVRDELQLRAREETWVEIRRANGNGLLLSRVMKPGESETFTVAEPLSLVIGNAGGIDLMLRGSPVPLRGGSGNVTKMTVK